MMGSFLTRGFVMVFGYAYPAYECFKTVEKNKPDIEQLRFWCQYWILVAALTVFERVGDTFVSWVPMYSEAKLAFFIYLWYPKTKGTAYVYDSFFRPFVAKHETEIDRNILELRTRAGDIAIQYWHRAATYSQTRVFEILQYVASQSTSRPRPAPAQAQGAGARQPPPAVPPPAVRTRQPATAPQPPQTSRSSSVPSTQQEQVPSRTSSTGSTQQRVPPSRTSSLPSSTGTTQQQQEQEPVQERNPPASPARAAVVQSEAVKSVAKLISQSSESEAEAMQIEAESSSANESANPPPQETVMEEVIRVTRGRLRKNRAVTTR